MNQRNLFDENYGLASTQALKNKDIPEGGSKGVILPDIGAIPRQCFEKYVDGILDLLLPGRSPGIKESIVDFYKKEEIVSTLQSTVIYDRQGLAGSPSRVPLSALLWP